MTTRIRNQIDRVIDLKTRSTLTITNLTGRLGYIDSGLSLEMQIEVLVGRVTEMIMASMASSRSVQETALNISTKEPT